MNISKLTVMADQQIASADGVSASMRAQIIGHLQALEAEQDIRILFAAESGSRAWGFASANSDYDVRFVYVPKTEWYLTVAKKRDFIERMLPNDIDLSGWELRKALRLFKSYNGAFNEWLHSPIQYWPATDSLAQLRALLPLWFKPAAALHHYGSMAANAYHVLTASQSPVQPDVDQDDIWVPIKKLCYLLRALLACRYVLAFQQQPPTEFAQLLDQCCNNAQERAWIDALLIAKATQQEQGQWQLARAQLEHLGVEIQEALHARSRVGHKPKQRLDVAALDQILRNAILP